MASIIREALIEAPVSEVWDALRDFHAVDQRLVPGFVVESRFESEGTRVVTFFNGGVAREVLVSADDDARRLVYTVVEGPLGASHHNAAAQVFADGAEHSSRLVWITDVLPEALAPAIGQLMDRGMAVMKQTLEMAGRTPAGEGLG